MQMISLLLIKTKHRLHDHLKNYTVRIRIKGQRGTGFFVAPGKILTCAHVLGIKTATEQEVSIDWKGQAHRGVVKKIFPEPCPSNDIYPDIALIEIECREHPYVLLGTDCKIGDKLFCWGFSDLRPGGESCEGIYEGEARYLDDQPETWLLKFKTTQVLPGMSGAPLLNHRTREVCGMVKRTRDATTDLGGLAVRAETIYKYLPELVAPQKALRRRDRRWGARRVLWPYVLALIFLALTVPVIVIYLRPKPICLPPVPSSSLASSTRERPALIAIPPGQFLMGTPNGELFREDAEVQHRVFITKPFAISQTEVTQAQYAAAMGKNPMIGQTTVMGNSCEGSGLGDDLPVVCVSWFDAVEYCNKLSQLEGMQPAYHVDGNLVTWDRSANGFRLPTEAEWEYSARAGCTTTYVGGDSIDDLERTAWYRNNAGSELHIVASKNAPNGWGLHDVSGNAWEWVWDYYAQLPSSSATDPTGPENGEMKVWRGGSKFTEAPRTRLGFRWRNPPHTRARDLGIRIARSLP
jgi:formylglycine-generating enzyme required for sulfatase activity